MSRVFFTLAQFIYILWPLFLLTALIYSLQLTGSMRRSRSKRWRRALTSLLKRIRNNLLITWIILFFFWFLTLFAPGPTPTLLPEPWNSIFFLGGFILLVLSEASELGLFERRLRAHVNLHNTQGLQDLKAMDPYAFEVLISETYRMLGYRVQHIGKSGDHGVDVELRTREGDFWVVQCKRYNGSVGEATVRELYGTMVSEKADRAVLVTTAEITGPARAWAKGKPIDLVDGRALLTLIEQARQQAEGTLFDRAALFLERLLVPARMPSALRAAQQANGLEHTQPVTTRPNRAPVPVERAQPVVRAPGGGPPGGGAAIYTAPSNGQKPATVPFGAVQYLRGVPICPRCREPMLPRPTRLGDRSARALYRCRNYPECRVVLEKQLSQV